jgi:hypothetical protein
VPLHTLRADVITASPRHTPPTARSASGLDLQGRDPGARPVRFGEARRPRVPIPPSQPPGRVSRAKREERCCNQSAPSSARLQGPYQRQLEGRDAAQLRLFRP